MSRFFALAILAACVSLSCRAQKNSLLFSAGVALPLGKFAASDINDRNAGMATAGGTFRLKFSRKISRILSWTALTDVQLNPVNTSSLERGYDQRPLANSLAGATTGSAAVSGVTYSDWKFDQNSWVQLRLLGGMQ